MSPNIKKIPAIIQARMSSSRLPGKVLRKIEKKPMLYHVINQTRSAKLIDEIIIATTTASKDDVIENYCKEHHIKYFRGSEKDVLDRYDKWAKKFKCDPIVRITSDCPLIDSNVIDKTINKFLKNSYDYVSNNIENVHGVWKNSECNFPQGMTVEICTFSAIERAWNKANKPSEREHVFPYIQFNPKLFKVSNVKNKANLSHLRCTVDRNDDLRFVREIYRKMKKKKVIHIIDILKIIKKEPHLININNHIPFDEGYKRSLLEDKKHGYN